jgi:ribose transport system substrate-binding protein
VRRRPTRRWPVLAATALAVTIGGLGTSAGATTVPPTDSAADSSGGGGEYLVEPREGPYVVGLANAFVGNSWRNQMVAEIEYAAEQNENVEDLLVANADSDVTTMNSQISDMVASGVDILLVNAVSESASNAELERAHEAGVVVVSFDATVSTPVSIRVNTDPAEFGRVGAEWLVEAMGGSGSIIALNGLAGNPVSEGRWTAAQEVFDAAGVEVLGQANADWDLALGRTAAADLISAHPDITGIYSQGGAMSVGALQALEAAGLEPLPVPGEGNNQFLKVWSELNEESGWTSVAPAHGPSLVVRALEVGISVLQGEDPGQDVNIPLPVITQDDLAEYVRPDLPDSLWLPTDLPDEEIEELFS